MLTSPELNRLVAAIAMRDPAVAPELRAMAHRLNALADSLESPDPVAQGYIEPGGIGDRVSLKVVHPDGTSTLRNA